MEGATTSPVSQSTLLERVINSLFLLVLSRYKSMPSSNIAAESSFRLSQRNPQIIGIIARQRGLWWSGLACFGNQVTLRTKIFFRRARIDTDTACLDVAIDIPINETLDESPPHRYIHPFSASHSTVAVDHLVSLPSVLPLMNPRKHEQISSLLMLQLYVIVSCGCASIFWHLRDIFVWTVTRVHLKYYLLYFAWTLKLIYVLL